MNEHKFEFVFKPVFDDWYWWANLRFGRVELREHGRVVQQLDFPITLGSTVTGYMLVPIMKRVWQMYMATNAALKA